LKEHAEKAEKFLSDEARASWHDKTVWSSRVNRDRASASVSEWEDLREIASRIKEHTLSNLDHYLEEFEKNALQNNVHVHWATNGEDHNRIVQQIIESHDATKIVKSKSILTEECGLNPHLEKIGFEVVDTDLGERIIQFEKQRPSHLIAPAIHLNTSEISEIFRRELGTEPGNNDPQYLTEVARQHLREKFFNADIAITGVNFGIADTGSVMVCTNEGNADMGVHLAKVHIACLSIEKLIPKAEHLGVFLRLLARSATGQSITTYSSFYRKPRPDQEMHFVIVDNGRSHHLGLKDFQWALKCIRCGACINTCPVYRRSGGYSYDYTIPGPIGSILAPRVNMESFASMPFASTLCGSCTDVCPVKIDIHGQLYKWRQEIARKGHVSKHKRRAMKLAALIFSHPVLFRLFGKIGRGLLKSNAHSIVYKLADPWTKSRDLPDDMKGSFRQWYKKYGQTKDLK